MKNPPRGWGGKGGEKGKEEEGKEEEGKGEEGKGEGPPKKRAKTEEE